MPVCLLEWLYDMCDFPRTTSLHPRQALRSAFAAAIPVVLTLGSLRPVAANSLVINEVDADQAGSDMAEFVELYDGGSGNTPLNGYTLVFFNGSSDTSYLAIDLTGHATSSQGYFVIGNPGVLNVSLEIDAGARGAIQNGPDAVALYRRDIADFPRGSPIIQEDLVDALVYGSRDPDDLELIAALTPGHPQIDDAPDTSMSRVPDGGEPFSSESYAANPPTPGLSNHLLDSLTLTLTPEEVLESSRTTPVEVTATRTGSTEFDAALTLDIADFSEISAPGAITIPAGQTTVTFSIHPVDDAWRDGDQTVTLVATSPGFLDAMAVIRVLDDDGDAPAGIILNEIYPDDREDANADGEGALDGPGSDEFIELVNVSGGPIDLSNHVLRDAVALRHRFPQGTIVQPGCAALVFGGGDVVEGLHPQFGGALVHRANGSNAFGLGLNNSGDTIQILNPEGLEIAGLRYEEVPSSGGSLVRDPELSGTLIPHTEADAPSGPLGFTPGFQVTGEPFCLPPPSLALTAESLVVFESDGPEALLLTVQREGGRLDAPLEITFSSSDPSELRVPQNVIIPQQITQIQIPLEAIDDPIDDGDVTVEITASSADHVNASIQIQVRDDGDPPLTLLINELDADHAGPEDREFIELYDGGVGHVPLDGIVVVLFNGAQGTSYAAYDLAGRSTQNNGFFVLGDEDVSHVDLGIPGFTLQNGPDGVALYRGDRSDFPAGSLPSEEGLMDAVVYGTDDENALDLIESLTPNQRQPNEGAANNSSSLGRYPDGGEPRLTESYTQLSPTPGRANVPAPEHTYANWAEHFGGIGAPQDDPDHDGLPNALEYGLDTSPVLPNPKHSPLFEIRTDEGAALIHLALEQPLPTDVSIGFELSDDLRSWTPVEPTATQHMENVFSAAFSDFLTPGQTSFIRMVVTIAP